MLGRHLLGYLPVQIAQIIAGFGGVALFTRFMSPEDYGRYALALAVLSLVHMICFTWLEAAVARFHARAEARNRGRDHLATAYALYGATALAVIAGMVAALIFLPLGGGMKAALAFAFIKLVLRAGLQIGMETHRAAGDVRRYSMLEAGFISLAFVIGAGLLLTTDLGPAAPFAGAALAVLVIAVIDLPVMLRRARGGRKHRARAVAYARYGAPISLSLMSEHLLSIGDRFLIALILGQGAVGMYAAGYGLADRLIDIIFIWFGAAVWPLTIKALERDGAEAARGVAGDAAALMGLIAFPAAAGLALVAEPLAGVLIGEALRDQAAAIIPLIALGGLMKGMMTYYFHEAFTLKRRTGRMAAIMGVAAAANLVLNLVMIPVWGLHGAAWATVISYAGALVVCALAGRALFPLPLPWTEWAKAGAATAIMAAAVFLLPDDGPAVIILLVKAGLGALVYAAAAVTFNIAGCRSWVHAARNRIEGEAEAQA